MAIISYLWSIKSVVFLFGTVSLSHDYSIFILQKPLRCNAFE